jgi:hypothetical protein
MKKESFFHYLFIYLFFFCGAGEWTQGSGMLGKHLHLATAPVP